MSSILFSPDSTTMEIQGLTIVGMPPNPFDYASQDSVLAAQNGQFGMEYGQWLEQLGQIGPLDSVIVLGEITTLEEHASGFSPTVIAQMQEAGVWDRFIELLSENKAKAAGAFALLLASIGGGASTAKADAICDAAGFNGQYFQGYYHPGTEVPYCDIYPPTTEDTTTTTTSSPTTTPNTTPKTTPKTTPPTTNSNTTSISTTTKPTTTSTSKPATPTTKPSSTESTNESNPTTTTTAVAINNGNSESGFGVQEAAGLSLAGLGIVGTVGLIALARRRNHAEAPRKKRARHAHA